MSSRLDQWFAVRESKVIFLVSCVLLFYSLCFLSGSLSCSLCLFSCSVFFVFVFGSSSLSLSLSLSLFLVGFCTLSSQDNDKVWDFVFWLDWDTNSPASAGLLVAVSSACWHLVAVEESRLERGQMVDHSVYVQVWSEGSETWPEVMVSAGGLSSLSDEEEDAQCFWTAWFWDGNGHLSVWSLKFWHFAIKLLISLIKLTQSLIKFPNLSIL